MAVLEMLRMYGNGQDITCYARPNGENEVLGASTNCAACGSEYAIAFYVQGRGWVCPNCYYQRKPGVRNG